MPCHLLVQPLTPATQRREFTPSAADEASQWRRSGPLPTRDPAPQPRRQGSFNDAPRSEGDRDWSAARGARFTPSVPATPSGLRRDSSGPGREREREPSAADDAGQWRSARPLVDIKESQQPRERPGFASGQSSPSLADTEQTVSLSPLTVIIPLSLHHRPLLWHGFRLARDFFILITVVSRHQTPNTGHQRTTRVWNRVTCRGTRLAIIASHIGRAICRWRRQ